MSKNLKTIYVIKDVKFIGISQSLEIQWSKRLVDENDEIFQKINERSTIMIDGIEGSDASERLKQFIPELNLALAKENGELQAQINAISKECAQKVKIAHKESSEKMIAVTEIQTLRDTIKAHEENFNMAKSINDEIYAENQKLKLEIEELKKGKK